MIKVLAIDDEPLALRQMESYIERIPFLELVKSCYSAAEATPYLSQVDAIFTDINMPGMSGMDLAHSLKDPPFIIFTTAYSEYALEGYKVDAVDYLLKPFSFDEFLSAAQRLRSRVGRKAKDHIIFKTDYKTIRVNLADIIYVESMSEYIKLHLQGGQAPVLVLYSLKRLSDELPEEAFCRIHRSYIVSLHHVEKAGGGKVVLSGGLQLPVGDTFRQAFMHKWASI